MLQTFFTIYQLNIDDNLAEIVLLSISRFLMECSLESNDTAEGKLPSLIMSNAALKKRYCSYKHIICQSYSLGYPL